MEQLPIEAMKILDATIDEFRADPIDLLHIDDDEGENAYILNARSSYERTIRDVLDLAERPAGARPLKILEIGSYLGVVSIVLSRLGFSVTALDIPEFMSNNRLQERYHRYDVVSLASNLQEYRIPVSSEEFDLVIMCETLEHLNFNPLPVFQEINRLLRPSGILYLSLPNVASLVNRMKLLCGHSIHNPISDYAAQLTKACNMIVGIHWREYTSEEVSELLSRTGFTAVRQYFFSPQRSPRAVAFLYRLFPCLQQNQTIIAKKESAHPLCVDCNDRSMVSTIGKNDV